MYTPEQLRKMDALIADALGLEPTISWHALTEDESERFMSFKSEIEGEDWLRLRRAEFPSYYDRYHVGPMKTYPKFSTDPADSKLLRDKLAETWDYILGCGKVREDEPLFGFALYRKGAAGIEDPKHAAEADAEELAVVLCALKSAGIEVSDALRTD